MFVTDSIKYIGVDDKDIDLFESQYVVPEGISYNSYVIMDEKIAVMDTVDRRGTEEWLKNLKDALGGKAPSYLVISHLEPDHAANVQKLADMYPDMKLVGNVKTFQMLPQFFDMDLTDRCVTVKEGEELSLGKHALKFFMAPMVHWPEVMTAYEKSEKVFFSADGFGKFGALDSKDEEGWACEARRYYFNIVGKYGAQVQALLKKAAALEIEIICPLHGPVLKEDLGQYIDLYDTWSSYRPEKKGVLVAFASIHGNTGDAARECANMFKSKGEKEVDLFDLSRDDMAEAVEAAFEYDRMVLASATYDGGLFPPMEDFLAHLKSKNYQKRKVALIENGSWAPTAGKKMEEALLGMKEIEICDKKVAIKSVMKEADKASIEELVNAMM